MIPCRSFLENRIVRKLNLQELQFLPFLLIFLMPAGQPPTVESVVRVDGLAAVGQVQLGSGLVQVGQVQGRHVGVGGVGAAVEPDHSLVLLHPAVLLCEGRSGVTTLTPGGGGRSNVILLLPGRLLALTVQLSLELRLVERLERPVRSKQKTLMFASCCFIVSHCLH